MMAISGWGAQLVSGAAQDNLAQLDQVQCSELHVFRVSRNAVIITQSLHVLEIRGEKLRMDREPDQVQTSALDSETNK